MSMQKAACFVCKSLSVCYCVLSCEAVRGLELRSLPVRSWRAVLNSQEPLRWPMSRSPSKPIAGQQAGNVASESWGQLDSARTATANPAQNTD